MSQVINNRMTARVDGDFCVFLIGMRINRWWQVRSWWPVMMAMPRMLRELAADPETGFLGAESAFGNPTIMIQYWRSFEALEAYARDPHQHHRPAWTAFNRVAAKTDAVGIWHETYLVKSGQYEALYNNMPRFGLGKVGHVLPATGRWTSARGRIENAETS